MTFVHTYFYIALKYVEIKDFLHHLMLSRKPSQCYDIVEVKCDLLILMNFFSLL